MTSFSGARQYRVTVTGAQGLLLLIRCCRARLRFCLLLLLRLLLCSLLCLLGVVGFLFLLVGASVVVSVGIGIGVGGVIGGVVLCSSVSFKWFVLSVWYVRLLLVLRVWF